MKRLMLMMFFLASGSFAQFFSSGPFVPGREVTKGNVTAVCSQYFTPQSPAPLFMLHVSSKDLDVNAFVVMLKMEQSGTVFTRQVVLPAAPPLPPLVFRRVAVLDGISDCTKIKGATIEEQKTSASVEF